MLFTAGSTMTCSVCGIPAMATTFLNTASWETCDGRQSQNVHQGKKGQAAKGIAEKNENMAKGNGKTE